MSEIRLDVENIGGIESATIDFDPGTTLLVGTNASNKTSFLRSVQFALGVDEVPMRSGADEADVHLDLDGRTVRRRARRNGTGYLVDGDGWVSDPDDALLVRRFACLLGTNALRSAVAKGDDVESLLKEPMDVEALEAERSEKLQRKRELRQDVDDLEDVDARLEERNTERAEKRDRIEQLETELDELYERQESTDTDDDRLAELRDKRIDLRSRRDNYGNQIDELEATIERQEQRRTELESKLADATDRAEGYDLETLEKRRESIQEKIGEITNRIDVIQSVLTANREMLDSDFSSSLGYDPGLMGDELACWACGNATSRVDFEETIDELQELVTADKRRKRKRDPELADLEIEIEEAHDARRRVQDLETEMRDLEQRLQQRRDSIEDKRTELDRIDSELETVDGRIAERESEQEEFRSDVAAEIEETRLELQTLRREVERLDETVTNLEADREERDRKREEIEDLTAQIQLLTDRIENVEADLRRVFNETMDELLSALEFERIERVRLDGNFDIVIARENDGCVREDTIDHLAESEREIIGIVLALSGFLVYDVGEISPVLLLDSLGAFDAVRVQRLVAYFDDATDVLLAAVHPEVDDHLEYESISMA